MKSQYTHMHMLSLTSVRARSGSVTTTGLPFLELFEWVSEFNVVLKLYSVI